MFLTWGSVGDLVVAETDRCTLVAEGPICLTDRRRGWRDVTGPNRSGTRLDIFPRRN
jgi:hypothetical protein